MCMRRTAGLPVAAAIESPSGFDLYLQHQRREQLAEDSFGRKELSPWLNANRSWESNGAEGGGSCSL
jgi:hypothetical protein